MQFLSKLLVLRPRLNRVRVDDLRLITDFDARQMPTVQTDADSVNSGNIKLGVQMLPLSIKNEKWGFVKFNSSG
jgi:hypothetical protein